MALTASDGRFIDVAGVRTFYVQLGTGLPVVLLHGAPGACALDDFRANLEPLAQAGFQVIAYDQPGFGFSAAPSDYSLEFRTTHAGQFIDALGLPRYSLVGYSQGSYVATRLALADARVAKLLLVACGTVAGPGAEQGTASRGTLNAGLGTWRRRQFTSAPAGERGAAPTLETVRARTRHELYHPELATEDVVQLRYEMLTGAHVEVLERQRVSARPRPVWDDLPNLQVRTLVCWGLHDEGPALERALMLIEQLPNAELHVFAHSGHWVPYDEAERFNQVVVDFLRQP